MTTCDSTPPHARFSPLFCLTAALWLLPVLGSAQPSAECDDASSSSSSETACAPDQALALDARRPSRRFATYSDVVSLVRARVSVGLVLAPFPDGPVSRLRVDVEAITRLRSPRGLAVVARVGVNLLGQGLGALSLSSSLGYVTRAQAQGRLLIGLELGYGRLFHALYLAASVGGTVRVGPLSGHHPVAPVVRLTLGHAFY